MCISRSSTLPICTAAIMVHQPSPYSSHSFPHICSCHPTLSTSISHTAARRLFLPKTQSRKCYAPLLWLRLFLAVHLSTACSTLGEPALLTLRLFCALLYWFSPSPGLQQSLPHLRVLDYTSLFFTSDSLDYSSVFLISDSLDYSSLFLISKSLGYSHLFLISESLDYSSLFLISESLGIAVSSSSLIPWAIAVSSSPKNLCECCFFLLEILSLLFSCLIPYSTHLNSNLSSSKKPFLASPYRNAIHQVFAITGTFHLTFAFLSSFEILWCFQTG